MKNDALDADAGTPASWGALRTPSRRAKETGVSDSDLVSMLISQGVDVPVLDAAELLKCPLFKCKYCGSYTAVSRTTVLMTIVRVVAEVLVRL